MNIIDTEDMIKGLPDAALQKEAQNPSGQAPQFLVVSEIKRRKDMRERYAQNQQSQGTVKDQLLGMAPPAPQPQMASMGQPQGRPMPPMGGQMPMGQPPMQQPAPPMGMYGGGVVRMAEGLTVPQTREEQLAFLAGKSPEEILATAAQLGLNPNVLLGAGILNESQLEATMQQPSEEAAMAGYDSLINPVSIPAVASTNPLDVFAAPSRGQGVGPLPGFGGLPQEDITPVVQQQAAPQGLEQVIAAKAANTGTNGVGMSGAGGQMKAAFEAPQVQAPPQRDPYTPMQGDLIKMLQPPATPEETRDPYTPMQGDLIKMLQPQDQTAPALTGTSGVGMSGVGADMKRLVESQERSALTGANGVGMSGVGADIKAGMEEPPLTDLQRLLGVTKKSPERIAEIREQQGQAINDYEAALPERSIGPAPTMLGGLTRGSQFMTGIAERERRESPQGSYAQLIEDTENERIRVQNIKLSDLEATIARVTENEDTTNPLVQKKLANLAKQKQKLTGSIATGSTGSIAEDAAKAGIGPSSTPIDVDLQETGAQGQNKGNITVVPNADDSYSDAATGTTLAGLDLDKDTGSSILDNQSGNLSDNPYGSLTGLRGQQQAIAERRKAEAVALNKEEEKYKELLENRQRPTLSYDELIRESEQNMATQLADIKDEKGTQALIALGAGIASGNLAKGLSDAGKAVATSNAQKRALEARQQAVRMGFRKSEVDAVYQNQVAKENDKLEGMKFSLDSLRRLNASTADAEQIVLNFDTGLETTLAKLQQSAAFKAEDRAKQDALNRRAVLEYVNKSMDLVGTKLLGMTDAERRDLRNSFLIQGSSYAEIPVPDAALAGSTGSTTSTASPATTTIGGYSVTQKQ